MNLPCYYNTIYLIIIHVASYTHFSGHINCYFSKTFCPHQRNASSTFWNKCMPIIGYFSKIALHQLYYYRSVCAMSCMNIMLFDHKHTQTLIYTYTYTYTFTHTYRYTHPYTHIHTIGTNSFWYYYWPYPFQFQNDPKITPFITIFLIILAV